jgi:Kef-type K+ transport system membrane component KefB
MKSTLPFYAATLLIFSLGIYFLLQSGTRLESSASTIDRRVAPASATLTSSPRDDHAKKRGGVGDIIRENLREPLCTLLLQIIVILITAKILSALALKIGQPRVIGEIIAGIILGPSLLGVAFPEALTFLFPASSMPSLKLLSELGVIIFMFLVGMEMNGRQLQGKASAAVIISHASIIAPFFLGVALSLLIYRSFAPPNVPFTPFALFMGTAMSITAFPVLARIIEERGMSNSYLGSIVIACAAVDDVTAWCILALVIAIVRMEGVAPSMLTIISALAFTLFMLRVLKPQLNRLVRNELEIGKNGDSLLIVSLAFALGSAYFMAVMNIGAIFGAFVAGATMPASATIRSFLKERFETFSLAALLPLFFAFTGLRTQINLLHDWQSWLACAGIIAVAIAGKLGGGMLGARLARMNLPDSISIGLLMNTRGLMELVVLNVGYDLGILSGRIFTIMVLMAIVTTCMTGPLLSFVESWKRKGVNRERLAAAASL